MINDLYQWFQTYNFLKLMFEHPEKYDYQFLQNLTAEHKTVVDRRFRHFKYPFASKNYK